jgi:hypothetical protein
MLSRAFVFKNIIIITVVKVAIGFTHFMIQPLISLYVYKVWVGSEQFLKAESRIISSGTATLLFMQ